MGGGSAKIVCTFLGTKDPPLEYHLFSPKRPSILLKQGRRKIVSVKMYKTYQSAPRDIKRCIIMQSFAFMPFLLWKVTLAWYAYLLLPKDIGCFFRGGQPNSM